MESLELKMQNMDLEGLGRALWDFFLSRYFVFNEGFWDRSNIYQIAMDLLLISFLVYVILRKPTKFEKPLTEQEKEQLIEEWEPEPLVKQLPQEEKELDKYIPVITGGDQTHVIVNGKRALNLARFNFLGHTQDPEVNDYALKALRTYGTGTCGPRGFYGTLDVHLQLEEKIAQFMGTESAIIYAFGFATVSSTIPTFAGRGDLLVVDKGVSFAIQTGISLSRSNVMWFEHNDMEDLERVLKEVRQKDLKRKKKLNRRFIIVEGVYQNYGDICPLQKVLELKEKYKYRLIMDDSFGIGIIGKTGRGTCEYVGVDPKSIEMITGNLASITGSVGGFCCSSVGIVYHQRLTAPGYVYSCSLPPLLANGAYAALENIDKYPERLRKLNTYIHLANQELKSVPGLKIRSSQDSPIIHLSLSNPSKDRLADDFKLQEIVNEALSQGVLLTRARYVDEEKFPPPPSIRIALSCAINEGDLKQAFQVIKNSASKILNN